MGLRPAPPCSDEPSTDYAKALVRLGESPAALGYGSSAQGRTLAARIRRLLADQPHEDSTMKKALLLAAALCLAVFSLVQVQLVARQPAEARRGQATDGGGNRPAIRNLPTRPTTGAEKALGHACPAAVEHAKMAYQALQPASRPATAGHPPEQYYTWSLRWMRAAELAAANAEQTAITAAAAEHLERMRAIKSACTGMFRLAAKAAKSNFSLPPNTTSPKPNVMVAEADVRLPQKRPGAVDGHPRQQQLKDIEEINQAKTDEEPKDLIQKQQANRKEKYEKVQREAQAKLQQVGAEDTRRQSVQRELEKFDIQTKIAELQGQRRASRRQAARAGAGNVAREGRHPTAQSPSCWRPQRRAVRISHANRAIPSEN